jgi:methylmalonyl-CoA mutase C-terminal domain/subunit
VNSPRKIRVLLAKPGLDTHERGVKLIAAYLRDAGMEVLYTGVFQTRESIIHTALQEDVDIIGLSYLCGGHQSWTQEILDGLEKMGLEDVTVICGGIIPEEDMEQMETMGVKGIYGPGTDMEKIIEDIQGFAEAKSRKNK